MKTKINRELERKVLQVISEKEVIKSFLDQFEPSEKLNKKDIIDRYNYYLECLASLYL